MRSTSFTMRSASSQISRVSVRSSSPADCSSSCAAPRMPDSGFLISCASMAASALTERAAPRWVSWRSILSAMVRSCSITTTWSGRSGSGATCRSTSRSPGLRGVDEIDLVFVHRGAAMAHLLDQRQQRAAERHEVAQHLPAQQQHRRLEEVFRGDIGVGDLAVGRDDDDRQRQRVEHRVGGAERRQFAGAAAPCRVMPRLRRRTRHRLRASRARATAGVFAGQHVAAPALQRVEGDAGARGRGVERPAEMLAGMLQADPQAVMRQHLVVERGDQRKLRRRAAARSRAGRFRDSARPGPETTAGPARRGRP